MRTVPVGDFAAQVDYGVTASASKDPIGPKMLRITDIRETGINWSTVPHCAETTKGVKARRLRAGDIVFARTGSTGNSLLVRDCPEGAVFASYLIRLRVQPAIAEPGYVSHFFRSPSYWRQIASASDGGVQKGVNASKLKKLLVPLPPLGEQRRIAAVLDAAEALQAKRRQALGKLDDLVQAVFFDMFGDPTVESGWPRVRLEEVCRHKGEYGANVPAVELVSGMPRYLRITDIRSDGTLTDEAVGPGGTEDQWRSKILNPGDLVFARSGATVGKTFLMQDESAPFVFAGYLIRFVPDQQRILPEFLYQCTRTERYRSWVAGAATTVAQPNVNASKYAQFELSLPPMESQHQFVDAVERIRHHRTTLEASSQSLDVLFASLQQRAFRGDL
ncbi:restriction endonuclease subunit S [Candidatus Poriferisodalis sp.]|uniref:restriction endonuclease subunit S n=1 Tax=Candidatus Poriferisodalis sp. TaxID=3101277 RepID=UPI003B52AC46